MYNNFRGRGLFVFSDPGGAKPVLAFAEALANVLDEILIVSDRHYSFTSQFKVEVSIKGNEPIEVVEAFKPDFLFTGTSYTSDIELKYIDAAEKNNVESFAFVDHWTSIKKRFERQSQSFFPRHLLVIDERARTIAINEGVPTNILSIFENPYHQYLKNWKPSFSKAEFFKSLDLNPDKPLVVYAPDPLSNVDGIQQFGFDEITMASHFNEVVETLHQQFTFVIKPHPNQNEEKLLQATSKKVVFLSKDVHSDTLIYFSDAVVGFFSNFLLEAQTIGKKVFRLLNAEVIKDPFADMKVGTIVNSKQLIAELNN